MALKRTTWRLIQFGIAAGLLAIGVSTCYGPPIYWRNFVGWKESDVVQSLGRPIYDSRVIHPELPRNPYRLGWYHGVGAQLILDFNDKDVVTTQTRGSK